MRSPARGPREAGWRSVAVPRPNGRQAASGEVPSHPNRFQAMSRFPVPGVEDFPQTCRAGRARPYRVLPGGRASSPEHIRLRTATRMPAPQGPHADSSINLTSALRLQLLTQIERIEAGRRMWQVSLMEYLSWRVSL